jgi:hypothetical protein
VQEKLSQSISNKRLLHKARRMVLNLAVPQKIRSDSKMDAMYGVIEEADSTPGFKVHGSRGPNGAPAEALVKLMELSESLNYSSSPLGRGYSGALLDAGSSPE